MRKKHPGHTTSNARTRKIRLRHALCRRFLIAAAATSWRSVVTYALTSPSSEHLSKIQVGACSHPGSDPNRPQKVNQDAFFFQRGTMDGASVESDFLLLGVMDGHGLKGHLVTEYMAKRLPSLLKTQLRQPHPNTEWRDKMKRLAKFDAELCCTSSGAGKDAAVHQALCHAFEQTHVDAVNAEGIPAGRSGTTCVVCLIEEHDTNVTEDNSDKARRQSRKMHVAWVGDSRAIVVSSDGTVQTLTLETTVANFFEERDRVEAGEGRIDHVGNVWYGPVGISMTRALGDGVMLRAGVVPTPMVNTLRYSPGAFVILASDGVFDVLTNEEVRDIVVDKCNEEELDSKSSRPQKVADELAAQARKKWIGDLPLRDEERVDDITCVVAEL